MIMGECFTRVDFELDPLDSLVQEMKGLTVKNEKNSNVYEPPTLMTESNTSSQLDIQKDKNENTLEIDSDDEDDLEPLPNQGIYSIPTLNRLKNET